MSNTLIPKTCYQVKCMMHNCGNLASHKVGEENPWIASDPEEKEKHAEFNRSHNLTTYVCDRHFKDIMTRTEGSGLEDDRFAGRDMS